MKWESERERELFFTTTSCTYYKIQNLLSNEVEVYKIIFIVKLDLQLNLKIITSK